MSSCILDGICNAESAMVNLMNSSPDLEAMSMFRIFKLRACPPCFEFDGAAVTALGKHVCGAASMCFL